MECKLDVTVSAGVAVFACTQANEFRGGGGGGSSKERYPFRSAWKQCLPSEGRRASSLLSTVNPCSVQ